LRKRRVRIIPRLIIFTKVPRPGEVKTRVAATVGKGRAAEIYRAILSGFIARLRPLRRKWQVEIHYSPADQEFYLIPDVPLTIPRIPQCDGDLGARLTAAFAAAFNVRRDPVVICGTDSPDIPIPHIRDAVDKLSQYDVVLGPCTDGGFYLVGLARPTPGLFDGIEWSTPKVLEMTRQKAQALGLSCHLLPEWQDLDTVEDVLAFLAKAPTDPRVKRIQNRIRATLQGVVELPPPVV